MNKNVEDQETLIRIHDLIQSCGGNPNSFDGELITQLIQTSLKLLLGEHDTGQLKLINRALKEMRYAYRVFNQYKGAKFVSVFGSSRTPENHPDYITAREFTAGMAKLGWMCITGAANGIMKAGHEGSSKEQNFGLSIRLPFEPKSNAVMEGDPKLIIFRYFFTRKLMFMSQSSAMAALPGGFGTMDELFEMLTLMQTGKTHIIPVVLLEGPGRNYWESWEIYVKNELLKRGWISPEDMHLYKKCLSPLEAIEHIKKFYYRYHSSRYVHDLFVIRMREKLAEEQIELLNDRFYPLVSEGKIIQGAALPEEDDHQELPRLIFHHTRKNFSLLRQLIDAINDF